ncbi:hypothetical protein J437_LFUL011329 [Ladona fulva]|uniref:Uncharacterized protein n=1 Tax=Ladona fulva TaxID=123851 RepID=A0A8K0P3W4_LADFU|nr:hypothetical protein J437_LFUL011329 [Ladona fulva]
MVFLGFMFNYMLRVNLTIAIVAMVIPGNVTESTGEDLYSTECYVEPPEDIPSNGTSKPKASTALCLHQMQDPDGQNLAYQADAEIIGPRFEWDEYTQNLILGCFFWGYICTELPGGRLAEMIGARRVFGYTVMVPAFLMVAQVFLGCDRLASVAIFTIALTINGAVTAGYLGNGLDIAPSHYSLPTHLSVPWKSMLSSPPVWAIIITHGASVFGYFTVVNQLPTYMKYILYFKIKENGLLSSLPYLGKYIFAIATSTLADHLRKTGKLSTTATRKIFTGFAGVYGVGSLSFLIFGTGELQPWNSPDYLKKSKGVSDEDAEEAREEMMPIRNKT